MKLRSYTHLLIDSLSFSSSRRKRLTRVDSKAAWLEGGLAEPVQENPTPNYQRRRWLATPLWLILLVGGFVLVGRLVQLQLFQGEYFRLQAEGNRLRRYLIRAERGVIYDAAGNILVRNRPGFRVGVNLPKVDQIDRYQQVWEELDHLLDLDLGTVQSQLRQAREQKAAQVTVGSAVSYEQALAVELAAWEWPMVVVETDPIRSYPLGLSGAHGLGYVGELSSEEFEQKQWLGYAYGDWTGKTGLELEYDQVLSGRNGARLFEVEADGSGTRELARQEPVAGQALRTSLRTDLLQAGYSALAEMADQTGAVGGAVVAQSAVDGRVLALVSYPAFDPNAFASRLTIKEYQALLDDSRRPLLDRAIGAAYPPGSTFKLVTGSGILEEGVVSPGQVIVDEGGITVGTFHFADWKPGGHGEVDFVRAIAESCDTYFYIFGGGYGVYSGLGVDALAKWAHLYGLGSATGIDIPFEAVGLVPDPLWKQEALGEPWYLGNTYHYAIGQGYMLTTPLQLNNVTVAVANGGTLYQPRVVTAVLDIGGSVAEEFGVGVLNQDFVSNETLIWIREGMRQAVLEGGTAYPLRDFEVVCGAKTGTSEFGDPDNKTHAWFTAFCPYESPEIVVTAVLEEGGEGSHHAGPVVRAVMEAYFGGTDDAY